jgi:hypothetical protein
VVVRSMFRFCSQSASTRLRLAGAR